jgi:hypothetical protein
LARVAAQGPYSEEEILRAYMEVVGERYHDRFRFTQTIEDLATDEERQAILEAEYPVSLTQLFEQLKTIRSRDKWESEIRTAIDACDACDESGAALDETGKPIGGPCDRHPYFGQREPEIDQVG